MKKYKYMHTINGYPASWAGGQNGQICYSSRYIKLCDSLDEIRRQQNLSIKNRKKWGLFENGSEYGYLKIFI